MANLLFRALYRYDSVLTPVPDLAAEPCSSSSDLLSITCRLEAATFSNGSPVTADDVKFTYDLARTDVCPFGQFTGLCLKDVIARVDIVDPATVSFKLRQIDPLMFSLVLPTTWIDSKPLVDAQYEAFRASAGRIGSTKLRAEADATDKALRAATPDCEAVRSAAEPLAVAAELAMPDKALWNIGPGRAFDTCGWTGLLRDMLYQAADALDASGLEGEALAYGILPLNWHPVGSGTWMINDAETRLGERVVLTVSPYAAQQPATPRWEFVSYPTRRDAAEGLRTGEIDWLHIPADWGGGVEQGGADLYHLVAGFPNVAFAEYADPSGYLELTINTRAGHVFADRKLRQALALCIDRRAVVAAASDGQGTPAAAVIAPDFWPANPEITVPERDVTAGRKLIEDAGWRLNGATYQKDGKPLRAEVWSAEERPERVKFASLMAFQARDCGIDLEVKTGPSRDVIGGIYSWPHFPPGEKRPFDLVIAFSFAPLEPNEYFAYYEAAQLTSKDHPYGNVPGYANPAMDRLVDEARTVYDTVKRARLYRQAEAILAEDLPVIPIWYRLERVALRGEFGTASGAPLDLHQPGWDWQPEQLVLTTTDQ